MRHLPELMSDLVNPDPYLAVYIPRSSTSANWNLPSAPGRLGTRLADFFSCRRRNSPSIAMSSGVYPSSVTCSTSAPASKHGQVWALG